MKKQFLIAVVMAGVALASGKSYRMNLEEPALLGNTELKAGEYRVEVVDQKAVIRQGKKQHEAPVKVETADSKYYTTSVRFTNDNGKRHIQEIHVGGTKTRLVFTE
jgi:hypothetical protein